MSVADTRIHARRFGWARLLSGLGVPADLLDSRRHHPCPVCGGKDRFRFIDGEDGRWVCNQCKPQTGDAFDLLGVVHGWDFKTALREVRKAVGTVQPVTDWHRRDDERRRIEKDNAARERIKRLWGGARAIQGTPAEAYVHGRGLTDLPLDSRFTHTVGSGFDGAQACMLTAIRNVRGQIVSLHRTFLTADGEKLPVSEGNSPKQLMTPIGTVSGAAARVTEYSGGVLGVAEGIETALAAHELFNVPVWACISANGVKSFEPPADCTELIVFGDRDENGVGQKASFELAVRHPLITEVRLPTMVGDWLDELLAGSDF